MVTKVMKMEMAMPRIGARKMNAAIRAIFSRLMLPISNPAPASAAPAKPPMRVCDELLGMPYHQVSRFQVMAASRPASTTRNVMNSSFTVLATVLATWWSLKMK